MKIAVSLLALIVPLSGCALWSDFKHPQTETPKEWSATPTDSKAAWPDTDWWKQFHSDALTKQIEEAQSANFDLKAAMARVKQADAQVRINGSALLPSIGATADAGRSRAIGAGGKPRNALNAGLDASYEIDFWGKNLSAAESAQALAQASRFDQETVTLTTLASVANTYFDILATQERLKVAQENLASAQELLDSINKRFQQGISTGLDVAQQASEVATQRAAVPPLELHLRQDLDAQAILLGKLPENVSAPAETLDVLTMPDIIAGLPSELLRRRPDVQNAEAQLASAHANIINARAQFFPSISLTASGGYQSAALANLFRPDSMLWSLAASAAQPIFEGGLLQGQLDLAKARYDELLQNYRKAVIAAFSDTEDALAAAEQTAAEEKAQAAAAAAARTAYDLTLQQLKGGIVDISTVLITQRALFSANDAYAQAKLAHLQAVVGLYRALGGGWKIAPLAP